jgi:hypothetical protein
VEGHQENKTSQKTSPCKVSQGTWARSNVEKAHAFAEHLEKRFFSSIPQKMDPKRKRHLYNFWRPPNNPSHQSNVSKEVKFKKLLTA